MPRIEPFEAHAERYDAWFERHQASYVSELLALRAFVPLSGRGLEIGVGGGRFAAPLGVEVGVDPSRTMLERARARGIEVFEGAAEHLPFADDSFDHALVVTTLCFVDSPAAMLAEGNRSLSGVLLQPPCARNNPSHIHQGGAGSDQGDSDQQQVAAAWSSGMASGHRAVCREWVGGRAVLRP